MRSALRRKASNVNDPSKLLVIGEATTGDVVTFEGRSGRYEVVRAETTQTVLAELAKLQDVAGIISMSGPLNEKSPLNEAAQYEQMMRSMPDGVVVLDEENRITWSNRRLGEWTKQESVVGRKFYQVLNSPEILGPDLCPFDTARASGRPSSSTLHAGDSYYRVHAAPLVEAAARNLIVTLRDVTAEVLQQQKLAAIHRAGVELADLSPEELFRMTVDERIELLKANILHYTQQLLHFDIVEIRLLDTTTGKLEPLLAVGMSPEAQRRVLYAEPKGNGVTGFVAATRKSYICEDTTSDPLYLEGCSNGRSSLTVPLMLHEEVIGTFNVESPDPRASPIRTSSSWRSSRGTSPWRSTRWNCSSSSGPVRPR